MSYRPQTTKDPVKHKSRVKTSSKQVRQTAQDVPHESDMDGDDFDENDAIRHQGYLFYLAESSSPIRFLIHSLLEVKFVCYSHKSTSSTHYRMCIDWERNPCDHRFHQARTLYTTDELIIRSGFKVARSILISHFWLHIVFLHNYFLT